jgi:putative ABC transport system permease protein
MPGYLTTLGISLLQGRDLDERDNPASVPAALVNEAFVAKYFPDGSAIGRRVRLEQGGSENQWLTIVGVVSDVRQLRMNDPVLPQIYRAHAQAPDASRRMAFVLRSSMDVGGLLRSFREAVRSQDPSVAIFDAEPMPEFIAHSFGGEKLATFLLGLFGALALLLTVIGIYGVMAYFVRNRTAEIGVRMALGAQRSHVFQLILGQGIAMLLCGGVIGLAGALGTTRVLRSLLFEVSESDLPTYLLVLASLAIAAFLACYFPARAAMRLNPMEALRHQ